MMLRLNRWSLVGLCAAVAMTVILSGCEQPAVSQEQGMLPGRIWDVHAEKFISQDELIDRLLETKFVLLGEKHDNLEHHLLQLSILSHLIDSGKHPALVMEQFDREFQPALEREEARPDVTTLSMLRAGHFNDKGWVVAFYAPLITCALNAKLPIAAANVSRALAWEIVSDPHRVELPNVTLEVEAALAARIAASHTHGEIPPNMLIGMVRAQRARDVMMAKTLSRYKERGAVLIAGGGHVRRDLGVPLYLDAPNIAIGFTEEDPLVKDPRAYLDDSVGKKSFDYLWFTEASLSPGRP